MKFTHPKLFVIHGETASGTTRAPKIPMMSLRHHNMRKNLLTFKFPEKKN